MFANAVGVQRWGWVGGCRERDRLSQAGAAVARIPPGCAGLAGLPAATPTAIVVADICRPEWLCEIEVLAGRSATAYSRR